MNKELRKQIKERARYLCEYCLSPELFSPSYFEGDHIFPVSEGGKDEFENFANACGGCNKHKSNATHAIDPLTGEITALYNPRTNNWEEHFSWDDTYSIILGITPRGRATIRKFKLNREEVVNLRVLLISVGLHPVEN